MPWEYKTNSDQNIIEVKYTGNVTAQDLRESTSKVIAFEKETGIHSILSDTTEANLAASLSDLYAIPTKQYVEEVADPSGHLAIILSTSPKEREAAEFFQIVCRSAGWCVNTFASRQLAIDWLISSR
jgi:hypothetical protein